MGKDLVFLCFGCLLGFVLRLLPWKCLVGLGRETEELVPVGWMPVALVAPHPHFARPHRIGLLASLTGLAVLPWEENLGPISLC